MRGLLRVLGTFAIVLMMSSAVLATDLTVSCQPSTTAVDGSPLPADETIGFNIYGAKQGLPLVLLTPTPLPTCLSVRHNVDPGTVCYAVGEVGTRGGQTAESGQTTPICTTVEAPGVKPQTPTGTTVAPVTVATTVYMELQTNDGFSFLAVGTVPLGTPCDPKQRVNDFNVVPASAVTWTGKIHRLAALAACSITN
jgi:hypothetical protein